MSSSPNSPPSPRKKLELRAGDAGRRDTDSGVLRNFATGATRDTASGKHDYDGFVSPLVLEAFGTYMDFNRLLPDGSTRDSDNWQKGIPLPVYMKSGWRHMVDWWREHRGYLSHEGVVWACCGLLFNVNGYLHEFLKAHPDALALALDAANERRKKDPRFARGGVLTEGKVVKP